MWDSQMAGSVPTATIGHPLRVCKQWRPPMGSMPDGPYRTKKPGCPVLAGHPGEAQHHSLGRQGIAWPEVVPGEVKPHGWCLRPGKIRIQANPRSSAVWASVAEL